MKRSRRASAVACDVDPRRRRFADHAQPLNETDENSGGTCRLNAISQLARHLRPGKGIRHPRLHDFEKVRDATTDFSILASQFHGCGHQQASAPALGAGRAVDVAGKVGPQAVDRLSAEVQFDYPSVSGHRQCSDQAHAKRASACHRKRRKGCRARASSREEGPGAPWRDNRATRTRPSRVRQRLPRRNCGGGHGATALGFGGSSPIYRPIGL